MKLYRIRLRPLSAWRTPWQADTLTGLLCRTCAQRDGVEALRRDILEPALAGRPPFVLSDAFPGDLLPLPEIVRLGDWPAPERKAVKRARWLTRDGFRRAQRGERLAASDLLPDEVYRRHAQTHNTLDRLSDTTGNEGSLFQRAETWLDPRSPLIDGAAYLSVYARVSGDFVERLSGLLAELSQTGFGADVATGKGQFEPAGEFEPSDWFDDVPDADGVIALSTFQPSAADPVKGVWEAFVKYGKLGPDFGLENANVFKRPLLMLRPGACFSTAERRAFLGRAIPLAQLVSGSTAGRLQAAGIEVIQAAFGLAVPAIIPLEDD